MSKTKRFEMRLDSELLNRVEQWRREQSNLPSQAEAMRQLLEIALAKTQRAEELILNKPNRLIISLLLKILRNLPNNNDEKVNAEFLEAALEGGHFWLIEEKLSDVFDIEPSDPQDVAFVKEVLDMWFFIERSYAKLSDDEKEKLAENAAYMGKNPRFPGFDGNHEPNFLRIANFLVEDMGLFEDFQKRGLNSHSERASLYARMLKVFQPIRNKLVGRQLNIDELTKLFNA